jgi:hypothetical protein
MEYEDQKNVLKDAACFLRNREDLPMGRIVWSEEILALIEYCDSLQPQIIALTAERDAAVALIAEIMEKTATFMVPFVEETPYDD